LDGVRAIAVLGVILFHADNTWLAGGFLGVDVFFTLSGYLITSLLLAELRASGGINFKRFYIRRARRLLPALLATLVVTAVLAMFFAQDAAERVRQDATAAFFYVTNWWYIFRGTSYFDETGRPPMLQHLWSLAVEEQFYFVWPILLYGLWRLWRVRGVRWGAVAGALLSTALMTWIAISQDIPGTTDTGRVYFGSDTHCMTLLVGAALATVWVPSRVSRGLTERGRQVISASGVASLLALLAILNFVGPDSTFLFRGGFLLVGIVCALLIAACAVNGTWFAALMGRQPLKYIGERSYGLYLWHWPIFMVLRPGIDVDATGWPVQAARFALTFAVAELSYRFLEMPIRRGALGRLWQSWREQGTTALAVRGAIASVAAIAMALTLGAGLSRASSSASAQTFEQALGGVTGVGDESLTPLPSSASPRPDPKPTDSRSTSPSGASTPSDSTSPSASPMPKDLTQLPMTLVGDSVLLGNADAVKAAFPKAVVDARVSRQSETVFNRIRDRLAAGRLGQVVVIHTGTNGTVDADHLISILKLLKDRARVVLVTIHANRRWVDESNSAILTAAAKFPGGNVRIADWASIAVGHRNWFYRDGIHCKPTGFPHYVAMLRAAINAS
jgi:peptidoglycan/LPS O-acetylase OafA/YrhL